MKYSYRKLQVHLQRTWCIYNIKMTKQIDINATESWLPLKETALPFPFPFPFPLPLLLPLLFPPLLPPFRGGVSTGVYAVLPFNKSWICEVLAAGAKESCLFLVEVKSDEPVEGSVVPKILMNGPDTVEEEEEEEEEEGVEVEVEVEVFEPKLNMVYAFLRKVSPRSRSKPDPWKFESAV